MDIVPRPTGTPNEVKPVIVDIPVMHHGRQIGMAELDGHVITIKMSQGFDDVGVWAMLAYREAEGLTIGMYQVPAEPKEI